MTQKNNLSAKEIKVFSKKEIEKILAATLTRKHGIRDRALFFLILESGLRISEICSLQIKNVIHANGKTQILASNFGNELKGQRLITITADSERFLNEYLDKRLENNAQKTSPLFFAPKNPKIHLNLDSAWKRIRQLFKAAGVDFVSTRSMRRTAAYNLFKNTPDVSKVQIQMGVSSFAAASSLLVPRENSTKAKP